MYVMKSLVVLYSIVVMFVICCEKGSGGGMFDLEAFHVLGKDVPNIINVVH